jgi:hypothetical protein
MNTTLTPSRNETDSRLRQNQSTRTSTAQASPDFRAGTTSNCQAWVAKAANQPMALETVDLGPLGDEDVEIAVEYCGLCHSDGRGPFRCRKG